MFSILMPAYNEEKNIEEAIRSILNQSYRDIELIVIDDGSTDCTWEVISRLSQEDSRLRVFHPGKLGKNGATNFGQEQIRGEWFSFFGADDIMEPGILDKWNQIASQYDPDKKEIVIASRIRMFSDGTDYNSFEGIEIPKNKNDVCHSGAAFLASRKLMNNLFPLPLDYPNEDGWMRLYFQYLADQFIPCPSICINYRIHDGNSLNKKAEYPVFNEQYHKRSIVNKTFLERYSDRLSKEDWEEISADYNLEMLRYEGKTLSILRLKGVSFGSKIRACFLSNQCLYRIKLLLNRILLGRA